MLKPLVPAFLATFAAACSVDALQTMSGDNGPGGNGDGDGSGADARPAADRVTAGLTALYTFDDPAGSLVSETSGIGTPLDLTIADPALAILAGGKLTISGATTVTSGGPATKIYGACIGASALTVEVWAKPATLTTNGRIISASADGGNRNFLIKQQDTTYTGRIRTINNGNGQTPESVTAAGTASDAGVQHVVVTRDLAGAEITYVNGEPSSQVENPGSHANWNVNYALALGSDADGANPWTGDIYLAAVYCRALSATEVEQNFAAFY